MLVKVEDRRRVRHLLVYAAALAAMVGVALVVHGARPAVWIAHFSWFTYDPPLTLDGRPPVPVLGSHYFGDWQSYLEWVRTANAYTVEAGGLPSLPPVLFAIRAVAGLTTLQSWLVMAAASVAITLAATWALLEGHSTRYRLAAWSLIFGLSTGLLCSLDRGSITAIAGGCVGLWVWAIGRNRPVLAGLFLAVAICLKPYLLLLLIWPALRRGWKTGAATVIATGAATLVGFALLPGSLVDTVTGYLGSSARFTDGSASTSSLYYSTHGMLSMIVHPVLLLSGQPGNTVQWVSDLPRLAVIAPGALWLVLVVWIAARRLVSEPLVICLVLSLGQLVLPSSQSYTAIYASVAALVLINSPKGPAHEIAARRAVQLAVLVTVVPIPLSMGSMADRSLVGVGGLLSAMAWLVAGLACAAVGIAHRRRCAHTISLESRLAVSAPATVAVLTGIGES